jgi:hypothetical protein
MIVRDLDGEESFLKLIGHTTNPGDSRPRSEYHLNARTLLHEVFPTCLILEEIGFNIRKGDTLYLDFYIPLLKLAVEVHGEQHYKYVPFYHHTLQGFFKHQKRDRDKREWCELNKIRLVEFKFNEPGEWKKQLA